MQALLFLIRLVIFPFLLVFLLFGGIVFILCSGIGWLFSGRVTRATVTWGGFTA